MIIPGIMASGSRQNSGAGATTMTWNSADKNASITLSSGDLTATATAAAQLVRATVGKSSGKWYFEILVTEAKVFGCAGIAKIGTSTSTYVGADSDSYGYATDFTYSGGASTAASSSISNGDTIGVAVDLDAGKIWFARNGVWLDIADPAAGTSERYSGLSGTYYPASSPGATSHTINASLTYSPPSGFLTWT